MPERILVVDDEPDLQLLIKQRFRRQIRAGEWEFAFAMDGIEGLDQLASDPSISCVLTDINMPRMDGLTFLGRLREQPRFYRPIVVSAYGDMENIRVAMNRGAFDFVTKPIDFVDLEATLRKSIEEVQVHREAEASQRELTGLRREIDVARQIQQAVLVRQFPNRTELDLHAYLEPARAVGGDFYDFFFLDDDRIGVVIADVSGKGISAALLMTMAHTLVRGTAYTATSTGSCLRTVNTLLFEQSPRNMFVTLFYGILDLRDGTLTYSNAGHNPPYLVRPSGVKLLPVDRSLAVALTQDFDFTTSTYQMQPGEALFLYTDGVVEAARHDRSLFGEERLAEALKHHAGAGSEALNQAILATAQAFTSDAPQSDDQTILTLRYLVPSS